MCESAMTADPKAKCTLLKAFDHFTDQQNIDIEPSNECYTCDINSKKYFPGEAVSNDESRLTSNFEKGSDYVFMTLPCNKNQFSVDFTEFVADLKAKNRKILLILIFLMIEYDINISNIY